MRVRAQVGVGAPICLLRLLHVVVSATALGCERRRREGQLNLLETLRRLGRGGWGGGELESSRARLAWVREHWCNNVSEGRED